MKVQTYTSQVSPQLPGISPAPYDDPGGRAIAGLQQPVNQVAGALAGWQKEKQKKKDDLDYLESIKEHGDLERAFMSGEMQRQGKDAEGAYDRSMKFYDESRKVYTEKFKDRPELMQRFESHWVSTRDSGLNSIAHWESQQEGVRRQDAAGALVASTIQSAGTFAHNSQRIAQGLDQIENTFKLLYPGRDMTVKIMDDQSKLLVNAFSEMAANHNVAGMKNIIDNFGDKMTGPVRKQLTAAWEAESETGRVNQMYDAVMAQHGGDYDQAITSVQAAVREADDPQVASELSSVETRLKKERSEFNLQQTKAEKEKTETANKNILEKLIGGTLTTPDIQESGLEAKDQLAWMDTVRTHTDREARRIKDAQTEADKEANLKANVRLTEMDNDGTLTWDIVRAEVGNLTKEDLSKWSGRIRESSGGPSVKTYNYFNAARDMAKMVLKVKADSDDIEDFIPYNQFVRSLDETMRANKLNPHDPKVMDIAYSLLKDTKEASDGLATAAKIVAAVTATGPYIAFGGNKAAAFRGLDIKQAETLINIPSQDRMAIENYLRSMGQEVTGPNILNVYEQQKGAAQ